MYGFGKSLSHGRRPLERALSYSACLGDFPIATMENLEQWLARQREQPVSLVVTTIGLLAALTLLSRTLSFLFLYLRPSNLHRYLHTTDGKPAWALVTGASDGIGRQLAHELASHGFNVVIHGRNPIKLAGVQDDLARAFPARSFRTIVADASAIACTNCHGLDASPAKSTRSHDPSKESGRKTPLVDFDGIATSLADLNLTVLINNAGGNPYLPVYQFLQDVSASKLTANMNLNGLFPLILQSKLLPQLLANSPSLVINMGSMADFGMPLLAAYCPTKALVNKASEVLARELVIQGRSRDVEVMAVRIGEVCGTVYNKSAPSLWQPGAETMARATLARVGCGRVIVDGYFWHAVQDTGLKWLPSWAREKAVRKEIEKRWRLDQEMMTMKKA